MMLVHENFSIRHASPFVGNDYVCETGLETNPDGPLCDVCAYEVDQCLSVSFLLLFLPSFFLCSITVLRIWLCVSNRTCMVKTSTPFCTVHVLSSQDV